MKKGNNNNPDTIAVIHVGSMDENNTADDQPAANNGASTSQARSALKFGVGRFKGLVGGYANANLSKVTAKSASNSAAKKTKSFKSWRKKNQEPEELPRLVVDTGAHIAKLLEESDDKR